MLAYDMAREVNGSRATVLELVTAAVERAESVQADLNAFITLAREQAQARAKKLDERPGEAGALAGVPVVVKDNICTRGLLTTAASRSLREFIPPYSATVVERLESAGAVIVAKTNLDEFGMGSSNENSAYGPARNPWDPGRVPGGSSGGSAVAVAAGVVPLALGTDTGGSVRQPASFTGVIGFKPTYGRLSRYGVIAYASSLDQVGLMARSARDIGTAMEVMAGHDPNDATSLKESLPSLEGALATRDLRGLRVGLIRELSAEGNSEGVLSALERTRARLLDLGAEVKEVSIPRAPYGVASYYMVAPAEASSNLARYDGMLYSARQGENQLGQVEVMMRSRGVGFGAEVRRRILMGSYVLSAGYYDAYYAKALKARRLIADDFRRAFDQADVLLSPTTPTPAYALGSKLDDPLAMYLDDMNCVLANLVGLPAISVPAGAAEEGLPCGMQFLAPALQDARLLEVCAALEYAAGDDFAPLAPELSSAA